MPVEVATFYKQEAQLMLTTCAMRLAVSRDQQTWYHLKRWYYTALHWHSGDVLQSSITFFFIFAVLVVWHPYSRPHTSL